MAIVLLIILTIGVLFVNRRLLSKDAQWCDYVKPEAFVSLLYLYYVIIGPLIIYSDEFMRGRATFSTYTIGILAATISFFSLIAGTRLQKVKPSLFWLKRLNSVNSSSLFYSNSLLLAWISLASFFLIFSGNVNTILLNLIGGSKDEISVIENSSVLTLLINCLVPCVVSAYISMRISQRHRLNFYILSVFAAIVFISFGFRYRLGIMALTLLIAEICISRKKPPLMRIFAFACSVILLFGIIGLTRSYYRGLRLENLEGLVLLDIIVAGFKDSGVFWTSSQLIDIVPKDVRHVGFMPIISTAASVIPRSIWQDKNLYEYMTNVLTHVYGSESNIGGAAILYFGEQYLMFGWLGIILFSILWGILLRWLWNSVLLSKFNLYAVYIYSVSLPCFYIFFSRGFMPLAFILTSSIILPCLLISYVPVLRSRRG